MKKLLLASLLISYAAQARTSRSNPSHWMCYLFEDICDGCCGKPSKPIFINESASQDLTNRALWACNFIDDCLEVDEKVKLNVVYERYAVGFEYFDDVAVRPQFSKKIKSDKVSQNDFSHLSVNFLDTQQVEKFFTHYCKLNKEKRDQLKIRVKNGITNF